MNNCKLLMLMKLTCIINLSMGAPRRSSSTTFDQKQTGEYNIQLHLKDFQIIAVVGDDSFSNFGDYDYSYDYSDFTVKPGTHSTTTRKPHNLTSESSLETSSQPALSTTKKPQFTDPYPFLSPSTTTISKSPDSTTTTTTKLSLELSTISPVPIIGTLINNEKIKNQTSLPLSTVTSISTSKPMASSNPSTTTNLSSTTSAITLSSSTYSATSSAIPSQIGHKNPIVPGQIPVIVQDFTMLRDEIPIIQDTKQHEKKGEVFTSVTIVPSDDYVSLGPGADLGEQPTLGEILHYRRCAQGYQRDKRGRCRKIRRPQIPLGITKFASNLAARFRQSGHVNVENFDKKDLE